MFGFSGGELLVLLVVAAFIMGPKNVAQALQGLKDLLRWIREWSAKLRSETAVDLSALGLDADDVEKIKNLNLSQYDPRQMVREAVQEEMNAWIAATSGAAKTGRDVTAGAVAAMQQAAAPDPTPGSVATYQSHFEGDIVASRERAPFKESEAEWNSIPNYLARPARSTESPTWPEHRDSSPGPSNDLPLDLHSILNRSDLGGSR